MMIYTQISHDSFFLNSIYFYLLIHILIFFWENSSLFLLSTQKNEISLLFLHTIFSTYIFELNFKKRETSFLWKRYFCSATWVERRLIIHISSYHNNVMHKIKFIWFFFAARCWWWWYAQLMHKCYANAP